MNIVYRYRIVFFAKSDIAPPLY